MSQTSFSFLAMPSPHSFGHELAGRGYPHINSSLFSADDFLLSSQEDLFFQHGYEEDFSPKEHHHQQQQQANLNSQNSPFMLQQLLRGDDEDDFAARRRGKNASPKLLPLIQNAHLETLAAAKPNSPQKMDSKTISQFYYSDSKSTSSSEDEERGRDVSPSVSPPPALAAAAGDGVVDVPFVPGTWKHCTFNQSQLLREFAVIPRKLIKKLVSMAEKEHWGNNNEVLLSYLNYTFRRLIDEKKILAYFADFQSKNKVTAPTALCFNIGLLTTNYERIFCFLAPNKNQKEVFQQTSNKKFVDWFVTLFVKESDILKHDGNIIHSKLGVAPIAAEFLPHRTSYFSERDRTVAREIVWNPYTLMETVSYADMIKNMRQNDHLAPMVQSTKDEELSMLLRNSLSLALKRAENNPRIAVPQYYWDKNATIGEQQMLLPLEMDSINVKCAATVRISQSGKYEIRTLLSLTQAYTNARLIQKIDQPWLIKAFN